MKKLFIILSFAGILLLAAAAHAGKIFVIDSYHADYNWTKECRQGFEDHIHPANELIYFEMNTKRICPELIPQQAEKAWQKIIETNPDIVVAMDDNSLKYLGNKISKTDIPLVFMGINANPRNYFPSCKLPPNVTGVLERPLLKRSLAMMYKVTSSEHGRFLLMMDNEMTSKAIISTSLYGKSTADYAGHVMDTFLTSSYEKWQNKILSQDKTKYSALVIANYAALKSSNGTQVPLDETSAWTSAHSPVPVFAFWHYSLGKGKALGGLIISGYYQGREAARMVNEILETGKIPKVSTPNQGTHIYSRHELHRWGLTLPPDIKDQASFVE
jgi:ABC-type uncharacterized transport system substrate-binding protein